MQKHFVAHLVTLRDQISTDIEDRLFVLCSAETQRNGLVFIYDMSGSKYSNFDYELSIKILSLLKVINSEIV